jgi:hypothetical protein
MKKINAFLKRISSIELPNVFNPYAQHCPIYDLPGAPHIRLENLRIFLMAAIENGVGDIWMGRDLGYRGGRRTGVALTDEVRLPILSRFCADASLQRATTGSPMSERTATVVWNIIQEVGRIPFLWNAFPFHPFESGEPMSNRCHSRNELKQVWEVNEMLFDLLQPNRHIGIGNDAVALLTAQGLSCEYVRHPSYGGQSDFETGIRRLYNLPLRSASGTLSGSGIFQCQHSLAFAD